MTGVSNTGTAETLIAFGSVFVISVAVVWYGAHRIRSAADYFVAGGRIGVVANALALAGDFVAAGGFLSLTGLVALRGADAMVFAIGVIFGWPLMLFLFAEPLRALGKFTFADVLIARLKDERLRRVAAFNQLLIILASLSAQLIGAAALLHLIFGTSSTASLTLIGLVTTAYILFGGMLATTWLQIIKAMLMMMVAITLLVVAQSHVGGGPVSTFMTAVSRDGPGVVMPGALFDNAWETPSLLLGLALGGASMPHVLMRMNTATSPDMARQSVFLGTGIIVVFHVIVMLLGFLAMILVGGGAIRAADPGGNMALPLLAQAVGGPVMFGIVGAVALSTILAVTSGLGIAGAAALAHDLLLPMMKNRNVSPRLELILGRVSCVALMSIALCLAALFRGQNLAFLSALASAIAASANFPVLVLAVFYKKFTSAGALAGMLAGTLTSVGLIAASPLIQVSVLGHESAPFPLRNPGIVSVPIALLAALIVCALSRSSARSSEAIQTSALSENSR